MANHGYATYELYLNFKRYIGMGFLLLLLEGCKYPVELLGTATVKPVWGNATF
jgi:hypothetical protein